MAEPDTCLEHCLDSNNTYTNYSSGHPISVDPLPLPRVTIHLSEFWPFFTWPPSITTIHVINVWLLPLNFSISEASCKNKKHLHLGQKLVYFGIFALKSYLKSAPSNLSNCKVWCEIKILKLESKNADLRIFVLEYENANVIFEISVLEFVLLQSWCKSKNP